MKRCEYLQRLCCTKLTDAVFDGVDGTAVALASKLIGADD